nr:hypothetical protein [uncultured Moellerella sp.]
MAEEAAGVTFAIYFMENESSVFASKNRRKCKYVDLKNKRKLPKDS